MLMTRLMRNESRDHPFNSPWNSRWKARTAASRRPPTMTRRTAKTPKVRAGQLVPGGRVRMCC